MTLFKLIENRVTYLKNIIKEGDKIGVIGYKEFDTFININQMKENNITNIIEFGMQPVLKNFFNSSYPSVFDIVSSCDEDYENIYILIVKLS